MWLAVVILVVLAVACFVLYRMMDLALAATYEEKFGGFVASVIFANKSVALVHAFCTLLFAVIILRTGDWRKNGQIELVDSRHRGTAILICQEMAYLAHDTWSMLNCSRVASRKTDKLTMTHHVSLLLLFPLYFAYEKGDFYIACMFLQSASTPLLHARSMLRKSQMRGSTTHKLCAMLLVFVFFLVRVLLWPVLLTVHSRTINVPAEAIFQHLPSYCIAASSAMLFLNCLWWGKLTAAVLSSDLRAKYDPSAPILDNRKED